jgi:predicted acylesterase/phospholipase RssA/CRP-like cAMP-binding protein
VSDPAALSILRTALTVQGAPTLSDDTLAALAELVVRLEVAEGTVLADLHSAGTCVWFVESGGILVDIAPRPRLVGPAQVLGEMGVLHNASRAARLVAEAPSVLLQVDRAQLDPLLRSHPDLLAAFAAVASARRLAVALELAMARAFPSLDQSSRDQLIEGVEWVELKRGEVLFEEGAEATSGYLVVSGGVLAVSQRGEDWRVYGHASAGEPVGEIGIVSTAPRTATVVAKVDSWLAGFARESLLTVLSRRPKALLDIVDTVVRRLHTRGRDLPSVKNRVVLLPLDPRVDVRAVAEGMAAAAASWGTSLIRDRSEMERDGLVIAGADPETPGAWVRMKTWLDLQRHDATHVFLIGDPEPSAWNRRLAVDADTVLLVASADGTPTVSPVEGALPQQIVDAPWHLERSLVLVHPASTPLPSGTAAWLDARHLDTWFHVRAGRSDDLGRVARFLAGRSVGLALSGGAARSIAHIGTYQALRESGVAVDRLSGTSAGAMVGALIAEDGPLPDILPRVDAAIAVFGATWKSLTLPIVSLVASQRAEGALKSLFGERRIEDLWIPLDVVTTDLSAGRAAVHGTGPIWQLALASGSPPGVAPPVVLDGHMHCDGGVVDNLPVGALVNAGCRVCLASSVGLALDGEVREVIPGPWSVIWHRLRGVPLTGVPTLPEVVVRAMGMAGYASEDQYGGAIDIAFHPPVGHISVVDFHRSEELVRIGAAHALEVLAEGHPLLSGGTHE